MFRNLFLTSIVFFLSVGILYSAIFRIDPLGEQKVFAYIAFFLSFFSGIWSFFTLFFFFGFEAISGHKLSNKYFLIAIRRALWVGLFSVISLGLQALRLLGVIEIGLIFLFFLLLEWFFLIRDL